MHSVGLDQILSNGVALIAVHPPFSLLEIDRIRS